MVVFLLIQSFLDLFSPFSYFCTLYLSPLSSNSGRRSFQAVFACSIRSHSGRIRFRTQSLNKWRLGLEPQAKCCALSLSLFSIMFFLTLSIFLLLILSFIFSPSFSRLIIFLFPLFSVLFFLILFISLSLSLSLSFFFQNFSPFSSTLRSCFFILFAQLSFLMIVCFVY